MTRTLLILCSVGLALVAVQAVAQVPETEREAEVVEWVRANAVPLDTVEPYADRRREDALTLITVSPYLT